MIDGGALTVSLIWRSGRRQVVIDAPPPPSWSRLVGGRPAAEAARCAGLVVDSCPTAHEVAARAAFGLPPRPADARRIAVENLREHAHKALVAWPRALGWAAVEPPTVEEDARQGGAALALALFGHGGLPDHIDGLEDWMRRGAVAPARVLDHVWRRWDGRWGRSDLSLWRPGERIDGIDFSEAENDGAPFDSSVAARCADVHLMREVEARRGRGVVWRLLARLVDAERLLRGLNEEGPLPEQTILAPGFGAAECAGGAVLAMGALSDGRVARYEQLTPTDCALHPAGLLARMLSGAARASDARLPSVIALTVEAADVRRPTRIALADAQAPEDAADGRQSRAAAR